ncbi:MAG: hypothetical protein QG582_673, partial [Candidatus Thermoplasmatota archaeon]|nr:hypothetical protein [Candidatus Thermoplasmatota archaeon]
MKWSKAKHLGRISNRKAIISLMVVVALVVTSAVTAVAMSPQVASIESTTPELSILNMTHDPTEALVDESVVWTVVVEVQEPAQLGKGLLFTWDWDDGSYTVYHMKSLISEPIAVDVQAHAWSAAGVYDVVVSVYDGYGPQKSRFHNVSATTPFIVKDAEPNTPPIASFYLWPEEGTVDTVFMFNANSSYDFEDPVESLLVRWDWESDSIWDTDYSGDQAAEHLYAAPGDYLVTLEVMDTGGLTDTAWGNLTVVASTALTPHDPIIIIGDTDFVPENGVVGGTGTSDDPYVIGGWLRDTDYGDARTVLDARKCFVIRNCLLIGDINISDTGIYLENDDCATVEGVDASGFRFGMFAKDMGALNMDSCRIELNADGVNVFRAQSVVITRSTVSYNIVGEGNGEGINVDGAGYASISSNTMVGNLNSPVRLYSCGFGEVMNNTMSGFISQLTYTQAVVASNTVISGGISIYG